MTDIRILHTIAELEAVVDLEVAVWGLNPRDAVPSYVMHVAVDRGGLALGAYEADRMVGMLFALPVKDHGEWILWSHMTGIHPDFQGRGVGAALKRAQRTWALENGYRKVAWTFDPLQRGNAHFNFHVLGGDAAMVSHVYHVNFYGDMDDDINRGMPSDRIEAVWLIDQPNLHTSIPADAITVLAAGDQLQPLLTLAAEKWNAPVYRAAVPQDLNAVRAKGDALAWRLALREALQTAFAHGYQIVDFKDFAYILKPVEAIS